MIKLVFALRRRPELSLEKFQQYTPHTRPVNYSCVALVSHGGAIPFTAG